MGNPNPKPVGNKYQILEKISEGGQAAIYLIKDPINGQKLILKAYRIQQKSKEESQNVLMLATQQTKLLKQLDHSNIVKAYECEVSTNIDNQNPNTTFFCIIMQKINGIQLCDLIKSKLSDNHIFQIYLQMKSALEYIHSKNIVHRDVTLRNILINQKNNAILIDFGISSKIYKDTHINTIKGNGTRYYLPYQFLRQTKVTKQLDLWQLGISLIQLITGEQIEKLADGPEGNVLPGLNEDFLNLVLERFGMREQFIEILRDLLQYDYKKRKFNNEIKSLSKNVIRRNKSEIKIDEIELLYQTMNLNPEVKSKFIYELRNMSNKLQNQNFQEIIEHLQQSQNDHSQPQRFQRFKKQIKTISNFGSLQFFKFKKQINTQSNVNIQNNPQNLPSTKLEKKPIRIISATSNIIQQANSRPLQNIQQLIGSQPLLNHQQLIGSQPLLNHQQLNNIPLSNTQQINNLSFINTHGISGTRPSTNANILYQGNLLIPQQLRQGSYNHLVELDFSGCYLKNDSGRIISNLKTIQKLSVANNALNDHFIKSIQNVLWNLTLINMAFTSITDKSLKMIIKNATQLKVLDISYTEVTQKQIGNLSQLSKLNSLAIWSGLNYPARYYSHFKFQSNITKYRNRQMKITYDCLSKLQALILNSVIINTDSEFINNILSEMCKRTNTTNCLQIKGKIFQENIKLITKLPKLKQIYLKDCQQEIKSFQSSDLQSVALVHCKLSIYSLIISLKKSQYLQNLNLSCNQLDDGAAILIAESFRNLVTLDLYYNDISNKGAIFLTQKLIKLYSLNLSQNDIGDEGIIQIAKTQKKLEILSLSKNKKITAVGAMAIVNQLKHGKLKILELYGNNINPQMANQIRKIVDRRYTINI